MTIEFDVLVNRRYGGFGFSQEFVDHLVKRFGWAMLDDYQVVQEWEKTPGVKFICGTDPQIGGQDREVVRTDPDILATFDFLGSERSSGPHAKLIKEHVSLSWYIHDYDGMEEVREGSGW